MKKLAIIALTLFVLMFFGCAQMKASEFWQHDTMYLNYDHMKFSLWEYKNIEKDKVDMLLKDFNEQCVKGLVSLDQCIEQMNAIDAITKRKIEISKQSKDEKWWGIPVEGK